MSRKLTFVHLSDIHFIRGFSSESPYDLDEKLRDEIVADINRMRADFARNGDAEPFTGVLVTGDIAFAGKAEEYRTAVNWLGKVTASAGCDESRVWAVPGNHDVDQSVLKQNRAISRIHDDLRRAEHRDRALLDYLQDTGPLLFAPLQNYLENFAARYGCLTGPAKLWWEDDLCLNDGSTLRLRGLNSAIISGLKDDRDTAKMLLGSAQTELGRESGTTFLVLCHHPPDWLRDQDEAHEALCAYSSVQLFGHKHSQRVDHINHSIRVCAGAVHPVRAEKQWTPRYNVFSLGVQGTLDHRFLTVEVYQRVWNKTERRFVQEATKNGTQAQTYDLQLDPWTPPPPSKSEETGIALTAEEYPMQESDNSNCRPSRKQLLYCFISLPYHQRKGIMQRFGLLEPTDDRMSDVDVFVACFERARKRNILDKVWEAIEQAASKKE